MDILCYLKNSIVQVEFLNLRQAAHPQQSRFIEKIHDTKTTTALQHGPVAHPFTPCFAGHDGPIGLDKWDADMGW